MKANTIRSIWVSFALAAFGIWACSGAARAQITNPPSFSGQATAVQANVLGTTTVLAGTGVIAPFGDALSADSLAESPAGLLSAENLHASAVGLADTSGSEASLGSLALTVGGVSISADFVMARARVSCSSGVPTVFGMSDIEGLVVNGVPVVVSGAPNQQVLLPIGLLIINEQSQSAQANGASTTVNGLHLILNGAADVVVASASAGMSCGN